MASSQASAPANDAVLRECASEPIHLLGRTQGFGVLLAIDPSRRLAAVSANSLDWCGRLPEALVGAPAHEVLPVQAVDAAFAHARVAAAGGHPQHLHRVAWPRQASAVDVSVHASGDLVIVEAELSGDAPAGAARAVEEGTRDLALLDDVDSLARSAARSVARTTGYDRVMVYRFAADGSGTVIAEHRLPGQRTYLGLRYPASDIPQQARALYLLNPIRVIVDARDEGLPLRQRSATPLDLSHATLRSVSPIHLQYMRNMGTAASMSISLIVDGRLWGLIACHHRQPHRPTLACRQMAELLGRLYSLALARAERLPLGEDIRRLLYAGSGMDPLMTPGAPAEHPVASASLARQMSLTGVVTQVDGQLTGWGLTPTEEETREILGSLALPAAEPVVVVESLAARAPALARLAPHVAGLLAVPLGSNDCVLLLRDEVVRHVRWAGRPDKELQRGPDGRLSPRNSFAAWRAAVKGHCEPWTIAEVELAKVLRTRLLEVLAGRHEQRAIESTRQAARQQALLVRELNHRVRNMLGLIKGLVQQTARNACSVDDLAERLHERVHALSRAYTQIDRAKWGPAPLATLVQEETGAFGEPGQISMEGPPVMLEPQAYLSFAMVIHELATNARKYGALSLPSGRIAVHWQLTEGGGLEIDWRESGGPPVAEPQRKGFGTRVIRQGLEHQLRGHATLDFAPAGLHARLCTPRGFVPLEPAATAGSVPHVAPAAPVVSRHGLAAPPAAVLVVEDDFVIAMLAESMLRQMGCGRIVTAGTADEALRLLGTQDFTLALIDINLGDHSSERVAIRLAELGVPTIVTTGYSDTDSVPEPLRGLRRLSKPYTQMELSAAVAAAA